MTRHAPASALTIFDKPVLIDPQSPAVAEDADHWYLCLPMLFNHRLVVVPKQDTANWEYGWCYNNATEVILALRAWNPGTQNEPLGWKKRATGRVTRTAPRANQDPQYNRPRCIHGDYLADGPCRTDRFCGIHE